ncbi:striatin-interacting protein 1 [Lingula anatina]|uniref:Striatin-interacting protein 1 n=1 Tax=Lingula anatina TaxID=7574 RepID=A0A1S3JXD6_LINAN|nr:striatin-interacting protein 1 [Lingula anatina]|eukprot:XP_013414716.1 striatin-interacting protein 1 [Lingula anatina]
MDGSSGAGGAGRGRGGLPKLRELLRRQRRDSETNSESPDLEFIYDDADKYNLEISELYSYTEESEFYQNRKCFEEYLERITKQKWTDLNEAARKMHILRLLDTIEVSNRQARMEAVRSLLYLLQGFFGECDHEEDQAYWCRYHVFLLYTCGAFQALIELLNMEMENGLAASVALRKPAVSLADSTDLRVILNALYIMIETMRIDDENDSDEKKQLQTNFKLELGQPVSGEDPLAIVLFNMVTKFCSGSAPHFPMKKVLLVLWKSVLTSLGGLDEVHDMKNKKRADENLPPLTENTHAVCRHMRAASPPASAADLIEQQLPKRNYRGNNNKKGLVKQSSMEDPFESMDDEITREIEASKEGSEDDPIQPPSPRPETPRPETPPIPTSKGLPWIPKVRQKDLELFLEHTRAKFVGLTIRGDLNSMAGLPQPIHEGVKVLKQHLYTSLAEIQIKREEEISRNPLSMPETNVPVTPAEILYQAMLPNLPQYMIALLKILLAAAPTSKAKTDSINILADVLPEEMPTTVLQSMKLGIDVNRHKEVIVKAISGLLLLLLKHFKLNHIYQFEYMSQHLVFANCIPLVLKFFNQNIMSYVGAKNNIPLLDFPVCVIGDQPELTAESLEAGDDLQFCWRNLFSCINLLRILNKLTKWKHSRTMMLVVFKSAPILKRSLKVKHAMMQLYVLKLLKMQTKYLGRQWRKSNMKTMSAIYQKVRHRLNDDWAYGNDMDARPWDFQAEECALRSCVERFNNRRYATNGTDPEFKPVDNCITSVLGQHMDLPQEFKENYERWVEREVYSTQIDWDQLLKH